MAYRAMIQPPFSLQGVKLLVAEDWQRGHQGSVRCQRTLALMLRR
jgi:hypothetical protein